MSTTPTGVSPAFTLGISGWIGGYDCATTMRPWESIAGPPMTAYNTQSGTITGTDVYLYGDGAATNPAETVKDVRAPNENQDVILAIDVVYQPPPVNLGNIAGSSTPYTNVTAITTNAEYTVTGGSWMDRTTPTPPTPWPLRQRRVGASLPTWNGQTFELYLFRRHQRCRKGHDRRPDDQPSRGILYELAATGNGDRRHPADRTDHSQLRRRRFVQLHPDIQRLADRLRK